MKLNMNKAHISILLLLTGLLTACNSTESALNVQGSNQQTAQTTPTTVEQPAATTPAQTTTPSTPPARTATLKPGKLYIAPIIGAPVNVVTPLTHRINDDARAKGVELAGNGGTDAAYVMKGYFSVLSENNQTTILYVWDVMDASGNRLHRIQGQEKVPGAAADSWSVVPPSAMQSIADKTMQEYSSWLAANRA
ncbi:hypothetical protein [Brucella pseudogrignonensis]|uniref:hypothetical protein n=1 Tax=Brucella pseudogrignonensis TaxID=419475 RepID=UPI003D98F3E5